MVLGLVEEEVVVVVAEVVEVHSFCNNTMEQLNLGLQAASSIPFARIGLGQYHNTRSPILDSIIVFIHKNNCPSNKTSGGKRRRYRKIDKIKPRLGQEGNIEVHACVKLKLHGKNKMPCEVFRAYLLIGIVNDTCITETWLNERSKQGEEASSGHNCCVGWINHGRKLLPDSE